jgi:ABC-type branched-subunit amino acid transport system substrate-binding protein
MMSPKLRAALVGAASAGVLGATCLLVPVSTAAAATLPTALASSATTSCGGSPITLGQIVSSSGTFSYPDVQTATKVAVAAVNKTCEDGRPLKLVTCNDQGDTNTSITCAHELVSDHVVAMVGNSSSALGAAMAITQAAGIPSVFNAGISPWEFTNKLSYSLSQSLIQVVSVVHAALGSGVKTIAFLSADAPIGTEVLGLFKAIGVPLGVTTVPVVYPPSTTDFAPVAAQAIAANAGAIFVAAGASQVQPLFKALGQQGLASKTLLMTSAGLFSPATVSALGSAVNGLYVLSPEAVPVDSTATNAGITKMHKEYVADRQNPNNSDMTGFATLAWSGVHVLADAIKSTKTVTPATVQTALAALGTVSQPQIPAWNATKDAVPSVPALRAFRILSGANFWYRIQGGKFAPVGSGAIPATKTFSLTAAG